MGKISEFFFGKSFVPQKIQEDLLVPRNVEDRNDEFFRNVLEKLSKNNNVWEGNLYLQYKNFPVWFELPDGLTVTKHLGISNTNIKKLPDNLTCESISDFALCKQFTELPKGFKCKHLNLISSNIKELPKDIESQKIYIGNSPLELKKNILKYRFPNIEFC